MLLLLNRLPEKLVNGQSQCSEVRAMKQMTKILAMFLIASLFASLCSFAFAEDSDLKVGSDIPFEGPRIVGVLPPALSVLGIVKLPELRLVAMKLFRGEEVEIVGETDSLYYIECSDGLVYCTEKALIVPAGADSFQSVTGYAKYNTRIYPSPYLKGNEYEKLAQNTELTVLDRLGDLMLVSWKAADGSLQTGYTDAENWSQTWIQDWYPSGGGSSGGSSGGGSLGGSSGSGSSGGSSGGQDGGDIALSFRSGTVSPAESISYRRDEKYSVQQGTVFADGTHAYLTQFLHRGEEVLVASRTSEKSILWLDGVLCEADNAAIRLVEDTEYEPWTGYIQPNGMLYLFPEPDGQGRKESTNTEVLVEDEYQDMYIVSLNGSYYCAEKSSVKSSKYWYDPSWNSGGSSGGGDGASSGSSSSGGSSGSGQQWTDPVF